MPTRRYLLLDKRNRNWLPQIESMMVSKQTIFVTVGAAHLVGPGSVLDMLCVRGWKVQRIKTGPSTPPAACPAREQAPTAALRSSQVGAQALTADPIKICRFLYILLAREGAGCYEGSTPEFSRKDRCQ